MSKIERGKYPLKPSPPFFVHLLYPYGKLHKKFKFQIHIQMKNSAKVLAVSATGKSIFVRVGNPANPYDTNGIAGYCANPNGAKKGDIINDFPVPSGTVNKRNPKGEIMCTKDGEPLQFLVW